MAQRKKETGVVDIDAQAKKFDPVRIRFRGIEYVLGRDVASIIEATSVLSSDDDGSDPVKTLRSLGPILEILAPELPRDDLDPGEEIALLGAVTLLMERVGDLPFRREGKSRKSASGDS